ncbi:RNA helicase family protein [Striga asiatica]|uniref:RNA helicase family protein n=1 Tax=Striga asiatica TaxID=4170 RepID=A0A5A7RIS2_STRAF|nr:RNA helicase family protein [Striga asiatica]
MGRCRGKMKKQSPIAREDSSSFEDEKVPMKRRGRPQKVMNDEIKNGDEFERLDGNEQEYENGEDAKNPDASKSSRNGATIENGKKRKRPSQEGEDLVVKEENGLGTTTNVNALIKNVSYRQNGSRRKNKPRRAAEVGIE